MCRAEDERLERQHGQAMETSDLVAGSSRPSADSAAQAVDQGLAEELQAGTTVSSAW